MKVFVFSFLILLYSCSKNSDSGSQNNSINPSTISATSGNNQLGQPNTLLNDPLMVEVKNSQGDLLPGVRVTWNIISGGGNLSSNSSITSSDGKAVNYWTLGPGSEQKVSASILNSQGAHINGSPITFKATIRDVGSVSLVSGNNQVSWIYSLLPNPLLIEVKDPGGQVIPNVPVLWNVSSGGGNLTSYNTTTGADGRSSISWKLGNATNQTVTATIKKLDGTHASGSPVSFTAIAKQIITVAGGNGEGQLSNQLHYPWGMHLDVNGNIYVADLVNNRIQKWAPGATTGITVAGGNGQGNASNQLHNPLDVFVDAAGNIFIADGGNNRIQKWASGATTGITVAGGDIVGSGPDELYQPTAIFIDGADNLYIVDMGNHRIQKWAEGASSGVTVAGGNGLGIAANQLRRPRGVYVDALNNVYVADTENHRIQKWAPGATSGVTVAGDDTYGSAANQLINPMAVFVDTGGNLYILDSQNGRVQKWLAGATTGFTIAGGQGAGTAMNQLLSTHDFYVDVNGFIYISDYGNHRVQKWPIL